MNTGNRPWPKRSGCSPGGALREHSVSLKAAALAFAFLPACVSKVAVGLAEASLVPEAVFISRSEGRAPRVVEGCCR